MGQTAVYVNNPEKKVYHYADSDGDPICNSREFGSGWADAVQCPEEDVDRRVLCMKCERAVTDLSRLEIAEKIGEIVGFDDIENDEGILTKEQLHSVLETLQACEGDT